MKKSQKQIAVVSAVLLSAPFFVHAGFLDTFLSDFNNVLSSFFGSNKTNVAPIAVAQVKQTNPYSTQTNTIITTNPQQKSFTILKVSGDTTAVSGSVPKKPFVFKVVDENNQPVSNVPLSFTISDKFSKVFLKSPTTDQNGLIEATWIAGRQPNETIDVVASLNGISGKLTLNTTTTEVKRPWGMSNTYILFDRPEQIVSDQVKGYKVTIIPGTEALGTYYEVMGFPGSYAGLQVSATGDKRVLYSTWDIDSLGDKGKARTLDPGSTSCVTFGGEGTGGSCSMPFIWQIGKPYEFTMTYQNGRDASGTSYADSTITIRDVESNRSYNLGTHRYAESIIVNQIYLFVEDFRRNTANCWDMPKRKLAVSNAQILKSDNTWVPLTTANVKLYNDDDKSFGCYNVNGGVETDSNNVKRWFMASADEVVANPYLDLRKVKLN